MSPTLLQAGLAFFLTLFFIWALAPLARRLGLVDAPDHRKQHAGEIPLVGGIAIYLALLAAAIIWGHAGPMGLGAEVDILWLFIYASGMLIVLGLVDDRFHLSVFTRTVLELAVALFIIESLDLRLANLGNLLGTGNIAFNAWLSYPFTVLVIFGVINAYNMLDGMDGLLGIIVLITILAFHLLSGVPPSLITVVISASLGAFLISNLGLAPFIPKSFLGDSGSKLLGFIVVALTLTVTSSKLGHTRYIQPVTAVYLLGLPLFDMAFTTMRRVLKGQSPVRADTTHIHHLLRRLGLSGRRALLLITAVGVSIPFLGLMLSRAGVSDAYQLGILLASFALYCVVMNQAWYVAQRMPLPRPGANSKSSEATTQPRAETP